MEEYLLRAEGLVKSYHGKRVVRGVALNIKAGEVVGLLGPNGAGKTTTFYMIVGQVAQDEGSIVFDGQEISHLPMYKRARLGVGYLSQEPSIFRRLTVRDNIMAVLETLDLTAQERQTRCEHLLDGLGLSNLASQKAIELSGGERRRLEITRALVTKPKFIMLDEPFSGVDPIAVNDVQGIIGRLREMGLGILITDHSVRETLAIVDRAYLICDGRILREGDSDFLINDAKARELYLGPQFTV